MLINLYKQNICLFPNTKFCPKVVPCFTVFCIFEPPSLPPEGTPGYIKRTWFLYRDLQPSKRGHPMIVQNKPNEQTAHLTLNNLFFTGLSLLLLIVSIVLITHIRPSTKPPQLFKESTNLEMLMDLKTSVGIIDEISCSKCSAIYDVCYVFVIFCLFSHYSCNLYCIWFIMLIDHLHVSYLIPKL